MLVMVIEQFKGGHAGQVYLRLRKHGRLLVDGVAYLDSWVDTDFSRCFQLMSAATLDELRAWAAQWSDLIDFEFVPVHTATDAFAIAADWESVKHLGVRWMFRPRQWSRQHSGITEHIIQSDESWYDAAISTPGEPIRLIGGAPSRDGAEQLTAGQLAALEHRSCSGSCDRDWIQTAGD
jgi:hypothetical protein